MAHPPGRPASLRAATTWMVYSYGVGFGLQAGYFVLVARQLGAREFGVFAAALAAVAIVSPLASFGSGHLLLMHSARDRARFPAWLGTALTTTAVCGGLLGATVLAVAQLLFDDADVLRTLLPLALAELFFARLTEISAQCFQAHDRIRSSANLLILGNALRFSAVLLLLASGLHTAEAWSWYYLAASATAAVLGVASVLRRFGAPTAPTHLRVVARQGLFFAIGVAAKSVYADIDKTMLARLASVQAAGIYTAAYRVVSMTTAPIMALLYAGNARLFREGDASLRSAWTFGRRLIPAALGYGATATVVLVLAAPLLPVLLGPSYGETSSALRWLAPLLVLQTVHFLIGDTLMGAGHQPVRSFMQVGAAGVNVLANLALIPSLSWRGAVYASWITEGLLAVGVSITLWRLLAREDRRVAHRDMLPSSSTSAA